MKLRVIHTTEYAYSGPVSFGTHRLMLRPRDGHDLRVLDSVLTLSPPARLRWHFDQFGNSVAEAEFDARADTLSIRSELLLERYPHDAVLFSLEHRDLELPVSYSVDECVDLAPFMALQNPHDRPALVNWLDTRFTQRPVRMLEFMQALSTAINTEFEYSARDELGTQSVAQTIAAGSGTCRDFAFFFMEAVRHFGFAARFVTGYLYDAATDDALLGGGATHAWAGVFLPNEGWVEFDPTNRITGGAELIRIASTRAPRQASPISGSFVSDEHAFTGMSVAVQVSRVEQ